MERLEILLICSVSGFAVSFGVIALVLRVWSRRQLAVHSAEVHPQPTPGELPVPRFGGLALAAAFAMLLCLPWNFLIGLPADPLMRVIAGMSLAIFGLGFWDDLRILGAKRKLAGQLLIASAAYFLGLGIHQFKIPLADRIIDLGFYGWPLTVFWLMAMTNLINLIDGVDGLAGGIALMLMILLAAVGTGTEIVALIAAGMAGALLAFLRFNFPPAKIYLGNGGAYFLGFLIGGLTIDNSHKGTVVVALIAPLFVLALPILDASLALVRRGLHGLPLLRPDRRQLHHRLLESGLSRRDLALGAYLFTAFFLGLGLIAYCWRGQGLALVLGAAALAVLLAASRFHFSREWFNVGNVLGRSLQARGEIEYALAQSRWLAMEGRRGRSLQSICDDTALVARRLGFARLCIRLEDGERVWKMKPCAAGEHCPPPPPGNDADSWACSRSDLCRCHVFRFRAPGHPACEVELQTPNLGDAANGQPQPKESARRRLDGMSKFQIVGDLLAVGWAKSLAAWHKQNKLPIRFHPVSAPNPGPNLVPPLPGLKADLPRKRK